MPEDNAIPTDLPLSATDPAPEASQEPTPMLDVHPPHEAAHSWKDFFIHIATIVVGLLIAICLEQTVEAIHHRHQRAELRESLHRETEEIMRDAKDTDAGLTIRTTWLTNRAQQLQAAIWQRQPLAAPAPQDQPSFDYPDAPLWRAAKTSGLIELLTPDEVNAYSEVELLAAKIDLVYDRWRTAESGRLRFQKQFPPLPDGSPDLSKATPADMRSFLDLITAEAEAARVVREWNLNLLGAEETIANGNLNLHDILAAEKTRARPIKP